MLKIILIPFTFLLLSNGYGQDLSFCQQSLEALPIQQGGRVKPLYVHAGETIKHLTGKSKINKQSPVITYCNLSFKGITESTLPKLSAKIEHPELRNFLGLKGTVHIDYDSLIEKIPLLRFEFQKEQKKKVESSYKKALNKLLGKVFLYQETKRGQNWLVFEKDWIALTQFLNLEHVKKLQSSSSKTALTNELLKTKDAFIQKNGDKYLVELSYAKAKLPLVSLILTMLGLITLSGMKKFNVALAFSSLTLLAQTVLLVLRVYISGRAPITNMYETVLFSGYGALFLAMILGHFKKERLYIFMGLAYNLCSLMMLNFAGGMLSSSIGPLVPVLRDNFWLSTHVTVIIMSYGALALSWVLANQVIFKKRFQSVSKEDENYYGELIYTCLKWGTTLLAAGILLGGVWADYSWGRFWGWDPKETWSLIVLCIYMAILHGKYTSWINMDRFFPLCAAAFMSVIMAWFGVNYILASGLHSYGFSEGGAIFIGSLFFAQTAFILICLFKKDSNMATGK